MTSPRSYSAASANVCRSRSSRWTSVPQFGRPDTHCDTAYAGSRHGCLSRGVAPWVLLSIRPLAMHCQPRPCGLLLRLACTVRAAKQARELHPLCQPSCRTVVLDLLRLAQRSSSLMLPTSSDMEWTPPHPCPAPVPSDGWKQRKVRRNGCCGVWSMDGETASGMRQRHRCMTRRWESS